MSATTMRATAAQAAVSPKPASKQDSSLRTPSWTDIVAAYHSEGNGDREMLLALLHAKAKEDERLAALDLLRAEQLRAYTAHLAVHGPLYPPPPHTSMPSQAYAQGNPPSQMAMMNGGTTSPARASTSSSTSHNNRKNVNNTNTNSSSSRRNGASRSPSLSHSTESRLSSPDFIVHTPDDERRMSGLSLLSDNERDALVLPPPNMKRKAEHAGQYPVTTTEAGDASSFRPAKRISPPRQLLPSISDLLPSSSATPTSASETKRATSPRSLQHILNEDLRPLSLSNYRAQTSDVRSSSASDDEDELAE